MEFTTESDGLVQQARDGSREAFAELVRLHQAAVRTFLARFVYRAEAVDDLAQEVFLVAFNRLAAFRGEASFRSWLLGIARNQALVHVRGEMRRRKRDAQAFEAAAAQWRADRLAGSDSLADDHQRTVSALRSCLDDLPPASRSVVDRYYFKNESAEVIARRMNKQSGAVRMMLLRIRRALGECVAARLGGQEQER